MATTALIILLRKNNFDLVFNDGKVEAVLVPIGIEAFAIYCLHHSDIAEIAEEDWNKI